MRGNVPHDYPARYDRKADIERLARVVDPELDEPILDLGFVRSFELHWQTPLATGLAQQHLISGSF